MGTAVMMYVLPMMLGQTYDMGKDRPGLQIYPTSIGDRAVSLQHYFTDSQYRMVENAEEIKDFLSVSGKLSLKIKSGLVDVSGEGSYLKDSGSKTNGIEILVKVHFETITKTIPSAVKPNGGWSQLDKSFLGTHFCRSITYGGDLVASVRITSSNTYDLMRIKAAINGGVNAKGGSFKANVKGKLDLLKQNAQDSSSMEIKYYASVPIHGVSYDVDGLLKLVEDFPQHVKRVNNGTGNPLRMELYPLSSLEAGWPAYFENRALSDELDDMDNQFDDLRETRRKIGVWVMSLPPIVPDDATEKIKKFTDKVNRIYGVYLQSISELDVSVNASGQPFIDAFEAYRDQEYIMYQKYARKLIELQRDIYEAHPELKPRIGGSQYVRWGSSECSTPETEASVVGVAASSQIQQNGGSSDFLCAPLDPVTVRPGDYFPGYPGEDEPEYHMLVSPLRYRGEMARFRRMQNKQIACARCRTPHRTTTLVKVGDIHCPSDKWTREYTGLLMAPGRYTAKGQYVCVDDDMAQPKGEARFGDADDSHLVEIQEVTVECGSLPCGPYQPDKPLPCVVCTI